MAAVVSARSGARSFLRRRCRLYAAPRARILGSVSAILTDGGTRVETRTPRATAALCNDRVDHMAAALHTLHGVRGQSAIYGAIGGVIGASVMTAGRLLARRAGWIDLMVPQSVEQWLDERNAIPVRDVALRTAIDQLIHLGYGALWGAAFGPLFRAGRSPVRGAVLLTVTQFAVGPALMLPLLGIAPRSSQTPPRALAVNLGGHAVYAALTAFVANELAAQGRNPRRRLSRLRALSDIG